MPLQQQLLELQWVQLKHDEAYHKDVVILPLAQRIKHMALHNAKYAAYLLETIETGDKDRLLKIITDVFVITLASTNTLNQNLGRELGNLLQESASLTSLGAALVAALPRDDADSLWIVRALIRHNGRLAKACESWDHLEDILFREVMRSCNLAVLKVVLAEASARGLDLVEAYKSRIREVEERSIFDCYYREGAGGEA